MATIEQQRPPAQGKKTHEKISRRTFIGVASAYLGEPKVAMPDEPHSRPWMLNRSATMLDKTNVRIYPGKLVSPNSLEEFSVDMINAEWQHFADLIAAGVRLHTVPSAGEHYDGWGFKWDEDFAVVINARRGKPRQAALELLSIEQYRDKSTGFLSNKFRIQDVENGDAVFLAPERRLYNHPDYSSYSQPSLKGWATWETYQSYVNQGLHEEGKAFLEAMYGTAEEGNYTKLRGEAAYFINHRQNSATDPLIFNVHPNETGRDYVPELGLQAKTLPGKGRFIGLINSGLAWRNLNGVPILKQKIDHPRLRGHNHTIAELGRDPDGKRLDWQPDKVRDYYAVNDIMFNALHATNLRYTARVAKELGRDDEAAAYEMKADAIFETLIDKTWNPDKKFFYNLDKDGNQIPVNSITGLYPLLYDKLPVDQATALLDKLNDKAWFDTPFPIPTHPRNSKHYDPHYFRKEGPNWKGPVWINMNHLLVEEGLVTQARRFLDQTSKEYNPELGKAFLDTAIHIADKTETLLGSNDLVYEQNNPEGRQRTIFRREIRAGKGQRVENFMWPNIGLHFDRLEALKEELALAG